MSFGPNPWQQTQWDWRAAGNFICGGAGSGLIVLTALAGVQGPAAAWLLLAGLALIGLGLACVWAELGRPLRALHVFFNPKTSWMTREAIAATALLPAGLAAAAGAYLGVGAAAWPAALLALVFLYCQSRMLQAARGITAWREPLTVPLLVGTGLAEGAGLFWLAQPWHGQGGTASALLFGVLLLLRAAIWFGYRQRLAGRVAARAATALGGAGRVLLIAGTLIPLGLLVAAFVAGSAAGMLAALAGLLAAAAGAFTKFTLITRAGHNRGFALKAIPVRGARPLGG
jgi:phenylacetyl-CoA:acceptor oxidoreductase subunit 2